jgi:hypothetical protein
VTATAKTRRRWFGACCLVAGLVMLIAGETVLDKSLSGFTLLFYWIGCFVLTALAAGTALVDAALVRVENRQAQRSLLESTLQQIEREKRSRPDAKG